jgi:hypothetical protein
METEMEYALGIEPVPLAQQLRTTLRATLAKRDAVAERDLDWRVKESKRVVDAMIPHMRCFLRKLAEKGYSRCYHSGVCPNPYIHTSDYPKSVRSIGKRHTKTKSDCYRFLFGVHRHVALWAVSEGFTVRMGTGNELSSQDCIFDEDRSTPLFRLGCGLIIEW